ncbi:MAG: hypothetical protein WDM71_05065 [Ferruginibacter sp.]
MQHFKSYSLFCFFLLYFIFPFTKVKAQNVTSPYSILGIGDINTQDYGRYSGEGGTSISRRDPYSYNLSNPASLSSLPYKTMNFDVAMSGRITSFKMPGVDTSTGISKDYVIKRIALAFKVSNNTGIAFGLTPYSSSSYQFASSQAILTGNTILTRSTDGSGGINQVYFSIGKNLIDERKPNSVKNLSVGIKLSYLFGSLEELTQYTVSDLPINISIQNIASYYGGSLQGGVQYSFLSHNKKWQHQFGLIVTANTSLKGQLITNYIDSTNLSITPIPQGVLNDQSFKMPFNLGFGYSSTHNNALTYSFDINYYDWPKQSVNYINSYTTPALRASVGVEYSKKVRYFNNNSFEKYFIGAGASIESSYLLINGNYLKNYAVSIGGGYNLSGSLSFYGGLEEGVRGDVNKQQIQETYTNIVFGVTLKNLWYGSKKFGRFQ